MQAISPLLLLVLVFAWTWVPLMLVFLGTIKRHFTSQTYEFPMTRALLFLALSFAVFLGSLPVLLSNTAIGPDAHTTMTSLEWVYSRPDKAFTSKPIWYFISLSLTFLPFFGLRTLGFLWDDILRIAPVVFGTIYVMATYYFVRRGTNNKLLASLAAVICPLSMFSLVLYMNSFRNLVAIILFNVSILTFLELLTNYSLRRLVIWVILFVVMAVQYEMYSLPIFVITVCIFTILNRTITKHTTKMIMIGFGVILGFILLIGPRMLTLPAVLVSEQVIGFRLESLNPLVWLNVFSKPWQSMLIENAIILCLSICGLLILLFYRNSWDSRKKLFFDMLIAQTLAVSVFFPFLQAEGGQGFRMVWWFSTPILGGVALFKGLGLLQRLNYDLKTRFKKAPKSVEDYFFHVLILSFLLCVLLAQAIIHVNYAKFYGPFLPSEDIVASVEWIRDSFADWPTIFVMREVSSVDGDNHTFYLYADWISQELKLGLSNIAVYIGSLFDLLTGKPSNPIPPRAIRGLAFETPSYETGSWTIVVLDSSRWGSFYRVDDIEKQVLQEVYNMEDTRVYTVKRDSNEALEFWADFWSAAKNITLHKGENGCFFVNSFDHDWEAFGGELVSYGESARIEMNDNQQDMWIERNIDQIMQDNHRFFALIYKMEQGTLARIVIWTGDQQKFVKEIGGSNEDWKFVFGDILEITGGLSPARFIISFEGLGAIGEIGELVFFASPE